MENFVYYRVSFQLRSPMLGTGTEASIWESHVLAKAKKEIAKLNKIIVKLGDSAQKVADVTPTKIMEEIRGCIRATEEALGKKGDMPESLEGLLAYAVEIAEDYAEAVKQGEARKATIFMRDAKGFPMISTHMILGNFKENLKIITNNTVVEDKKDKPYKSKAAVQEVLALDVKAVEEWMKPSQDILRDKKTHKPVLLERPIRFSDSFGNTVTAIAMSEQLPAGTEFSTVLRVRANSMLEPLLPKLLDLGKNNGLGSWRGSGNKGSYWYKLEKLKSYKEEAPKGWS